MSTMIELDMSQIDDLLANSRQRGVYEASLKEFDECGKLAVEVSLTEGRHARKSAATVYAGFNSRTGEGTDFEGIKVVKQDGKVFLINQALRAEQAANAAEALNDSE